ncbi:MAG: toprim domain-containing protein [Candidatus Bipolaricaulis sp.]|nr:toprim domain-containing protein [Candidatus Bipolaricaulis sp.]
MVQVNLDALLRTIDLRVLLGVERIYCAWHDDRATPNMVVFQDHGYCFACGKRVSAIELIEKLHGLSYSESVQYLWTNRDRASLRGRHVLPPLEEEYVMKHARQLADATAGARARQYLCGRGITAAAVLKFKLGCSETEVLIPHYVEGVLTNVKHRVLPEYQREGQPTYRSLTGRPLTQLWPYDTVSQFPTSTLILTEGEFDAMIAWQAGLPAASVPSGVNRPLLEWFSVLQKFDKVFVAFDQDDAGNAAWDRFKEKRDAFGKTNEQKFADVCNTQFVRVTWPASWGKDITEARSRVLPLLSRDTAHG